MSIQSATQVPAVNHPGESTSPERLLFEEKAFLNGITEYGISWSDLTTGQAAIPVQGARFDIYFQGTLEGAELKGTIEGVDYLTVRADGRFMLNLFATLTTDDGVKISIHEDGILIPPRKENLIAGLRLNMTLHASHGKYSWVNNLQVWALGTVDWKTGEVSVRAYSN